MTAARPRCVAFVGLGLIGGSLARDLAAAGMHVLAHDRDAAAVEAAIGEGVVGDALGEDLRGIEAADAVVLALPVSALGAVLERAAPRLRRARLVMDTGSTKRGAMAAAARVGITGRFVGAHPLAGDQRSGWTVSRRGLFREHPVYLCRGAETSAEAVRLAHDLWRGVGGVPAEIDAAEHDHLLARTSHLPQALSTLLALTLQDEGVPREALGPGAQGVLRLAGSSAEMWTGVLLENADAVDAALESLERRIGEARSALRLRDGAKVRGMLQRAASWGE